MKKLYRYEIGYKNVDEDTHILLREMNVVRETQASYFFNPVYQPHKIKRVSKFSYNSYAHDTKEKAREHFIRRTKDRIRWYHYWVEECKKGLELIKDYDK